MIWNSHEEKREKLMRMNILVEGRKRGGGVGRWNLLKKRAKMRAYHHEKKAGRHNRIDQPSLSVSASSPIPTASLSHETQLPLV